MTTQAKQLTISVLLILSIIGLTIKLFSLITPPNPVEETKTLKVYQEDSISVFEYKGHEYITTFRDSGGIIHSESCGGYHAD